jgi:hypothetical protein
MNHLGRKWVTEREGVMGREGRGVDGYNGCAEALLQSVNHLINHPRTKDISQYRLLFGVFLLYTGRVPFDLLDSAALV